MAQTAAERQASRRARINETIDELSKANALLIQENAALRAERDQLQKQVHEMQLAELKAKLKQAKKSS